MMSVLDVPGRAVADIDTGALEHNAGVLSALSSPARLCAVVKANGYGHGAVTAARAALQGGAVQLAVATLEEALELRQAKVAAPVLVLGALEPRDLRAIVRSGCQFVAWDLGFARAAAAEARRQGRVLEAHVKLDTGMGRLGGRDAGRLLDLALEVAGEPNLVLAGVMTHFATADEIEDDGRFEAQLLGFAEFAAAVKRRAPNVIAHAANTAASLRDRRSHFDMVRCGIGLYGIDPFGEDAASHGLTPALTLRSYVALVKSLEAGDPVGYGGRWRAPRPTNIGILPIGYGDGVRRALGERGGVLVGGRRRPIVGAVSMDQLAIDLGETPVRPGTPVVLIGRQEGASIRCEAVAAEIGTIGYEVTCGLSARVHRRLVVNDCGPAGFTAPLDRLATER
jgi:alanine racemase